MESNIRDTILKFGQRAVDQFQSEDVVSLTPARVDNYLSLLSAYSSQLEERLGELEVQKATDYPTFIQNYKSNVEASMMWDGTPEGLEMIKLKRLLKSVDKIISACKNRLKRLENESYNRY